MSRENWWLDYVEGELDPDTRAEMRALLKHSQADREVVEALTSAKELLKRHEPPARVPADDEFFDALHDKIMAGVEEAVMKPAPRVRMPSTQAIRRAMSSRKGLAAFVGLVLSLCFLSTSSQQGRSVESVAMNSSFMQAALQNPEESFQLLAAQGQSDFFVDVTSTSFDDLTIGQLEGLLKTKVR